MSMGAASVGTGWRPSDPMQGLFYWGKLEGVLAYRQLIEMTKPTQPKRTIIFRTQQN